MADANFEDFFGGVSPFQIGDEIITYGTTLSDGKILLSQQGDSFLDSDFPLLSALVKPFSFTNWNTVSGQSTGPVNTDDINMTMIRGGAAFLTNSINSAISTFVVTLAAGIGLSEDVALEGTNWLVCGTNSGGVTWYSTTGADTSYTETSLTSFSNPVGVDISGTVSLIVGDNTGSPIIQRNTSSGAGAYSNVSSIGGISDPLKSVIIVGSKAIAVGDNGVIIVSSNSGATFSIATTNPFSGNLKRVHLDVSGKAVTISDTGEVGISINNGVDWTLLSTPFSSTNQANDCWVFSNGDLRLIDSVNQYHTDNDFTTFIKQQIHTSVANGVGISFSSSNYAVISETAGTTFVRATLQATTFTLEDNSVDFNFGLLGPKVVADKL